MLLVSILKIVAPEKIKMSGNGKPLQCSCLENPRDGEAWWAAIYGVTQSRTRLRRLSSSSSSSKRYLGNSMLFKCLWYWSTILARRIHRHPHFDYRVSNQSDNKIFSISWVSLYFRRLL